MAEAKELDLLHEAHTKFEATGIKTGYQAAIDFTAGAIGKSHFDRLSTFISYFFFFFSNGNLKNIFRHLSA